MVKFGLLIFWDLATLIEKPLRQVNLAELFLIGRLVLIELPFLHLKFFLLLWAPVKVVLQQNWGFQAPAVQKKQNNLRHRKFRVAQKFQISCTHNNL